MLIPKYTNIKDVPVYEDYEVNELSRDGYQLIDLSDLWHSNIIEEDPDINLDEAIRQTSDFIHQKNERVYDIYEPFLINYHNTVYLVFLS